MDCPEGDGARSASCRHGRCQEGKESSWESGILWSLEPRTSSVLCLPPRRIEFDPAIQAVTVKLNGEAVIVNAERIGLNSLKHWKIEWSSYKGLTVDTLAHRGDE
ncbi:MAG: hypothetical protein ACO24D_19455, partial [bacterium]